MKNAVEYVLRMGGEEYGIVRSDLILKKYRSRFSLNGILGQ